MSLLHAARRMIRLSLEDGIPARSLRVAIVVGIILNLINQGDALFGLVRPHWMKMILTFIVPYCVATYGAVSYRLRESEGAE
ncbi:MAG: nitrate/nitrite transporter NrtS [Rhodospirillales bacterium]|nr:nitrate/nitrite transporter NrtS [Rhodospirillales bacterium]